MIYPLTLLVFHFAGLPWWPGARPGRPQRSFAAAVGHTGIGRHGGGGAATDDAQRCHWVMGSTGAIGVSRVASGI